MFGRPTDTVLPPVGTGVCRYGLRCTLKSQVRTLEKPSGSVTVTLAVCGVLSPKGDEGV
jgi:hypothetical protein